MGNESSDTFGPGDHTRSSKKKRPAGKVHRLALITGLGDEATQIKGLVEELSEISSVTLIDVQATVDARWLGSFDYVVAIVTTQMTAALAEALNLEATIVMRPSTISAELLSGSNIGALQDALRDRETIVFTSPINARAELRLRLRRPQTPILSLADEITPSARERARALYQRGQVVEALSAYELLLNSADISDEDRTAAQLGTILCLIAMEREADARDRAAALNVSALSAPARLTAARAFALLAIDRDAEVQEEQLDELRAFDEVRSGSVPATRPKTPDLALQASTLLIREKRFETAAAWILAVTSDASSHALVGVFFLEVAADLVEAWSWNTPSDSPLSHEMAVGLLAAFDTVETSLSKAVLDRTLMVRLLRATFQVAMRTVDPTKSDLRARELDDIGAPLPKHDEFTSAVEAAKRGDIEGGSSLLRTTEPEWRGRLQRIMMLFFADQRALGLKELLELVAEVPGVPIIEAETTRRLIAQRRYTEAMQHAEAAFLLLPGIGQRLMLTECLLALGKSSRAADLVQPLAEKDKRARVLFAQSLESSDLTQALLQWNRHVGDDPNDWEAALHLAALYARAGALEEGAGLAWKLVQERSTNLPSPILYQTALLQNAAPISAIEQLRRITAIHDVLLAKGKREDDKLRVILWEHIRARVPLPASDPLALAQTSLPADAAEDDREQAARQSDLRRGLNRLYNWGHISLDSSSAALAPDPSQLVLRLGDSVALAAGEPDDRSSEPSLTNYRELQMGLYELLALARLDLLDPLSKRLGDELQLRVYDETPVALLQIIVKLSQEQPSEQVTLASRVLAAAAEHRYTVITEQREGVCWVSQLRTDEEQDLASFLAWLRDRGSLSVNTYVRAAAGLPAPERDAALCTPIGLRASALRWLTERDLLPILSRALGEKLYVLGSDLEELRASTSRAQRRAEALELARETHAWLGKQQLANRALLVQRCSVLAPNIKPGAIDAQVLSVGYALSAREDLVDAPGRCLVMLDALNRDVFSTAVFLPRSLQAFDWTEPLYRAAQQRYKPTAAHVHGLAWLATEIAPDRSTEVIEELLSWGDSSAFSTQSLLQLWKDYPTFQGRAAQILTMQEAPLSEWRHARNLAAHFSLAKIEGQFLRLTLKSNERSAVYDGWFALLTRWHQVSAPQKIWLLTFVLSGLVDAAPDAFVSIPGSDRYRLSPDSTVDAAASALADWSLSESNDIVGHAVTELLLTIDNHRAGDPTKVDLAPIVMLLTKAKPPTDSLSLSHSWMEPFIILACTWLSNPLGEMFERVELPTGESLQITLADVLARAVRLAEDEPQQLLFELASVRFPWPISPTRDLEAEVPLEAVVLSAKPEVAKALGLSFAVEVGRFDGVLSRLLTQLATEPTNQEVRRQFAIRAVESPVRLVRHMPGMLAYWGRRDALPDAINVSTLEELRALLSEPPSPSNEAATKRISTYVDTIWKDRRDLAELGGLSARFPGALGWNWAHRTVELDDEAELARAKWLLANPTSAHFGELWWSIATEWLRAAAADGPLARQEFVSALDRVLEHVAEERERGRLEARAVSCVRSVVETLGATGPDALWLTYRLFGWWFAVSGQHKSSIVDRLTDLARGRQQGGTAIRDAAEPLLWSDGFDLRLSSVLNALAACPDLVTQWTKPNNRSPWTTALSTKSLATLITLASSDIGDEPPSSDAMDWVPPFRVSAAALAALFRNGGKFSNLPPSVRESWLSWIPMTPEEDQRRPHTLVLQLIHFAFVELSELSSFEGALLADRCLRSEAPNVRESPITAAAIAYAAGRRLVSLDVALERVMPHLDDTPLGSALVTMYLDSVLDVGPERAQRDTLLVLQKLGRVISEATLDSTVEKEPAFSNQEAVRERLLAQLRNGAPSPAAQPDRSKSAGAPDVASNNELIREVEPDE